MLATCFVRPVIIEQSRRYEKVLADCVARSRYCELGHSRDVRRRVIVLGPSFEEGHQRTREPASDLGIMSQIQTTSLARMIGG